ncbi:MAG TPA: urease accessory UreF family protein [Roseiflexaceae bacterium]|nr:urease accessory UreF family protein [Roseiflexaceae bacterium]
MTDSADRAPASHPSNTLHSTHTDHSAALAMLQLADSFFPSGLYTQSHGLERFMERGLHGPALLEPLLHCYLRELAGPGDALAARWTAHAAAGGDLELIAAVDARLEATKLSREGRLASQRCGKRLLLLGAEVFGGACLPAYAARATAGAAPGHQAVAMALIGAAQGLGPAEAALVELHSFAVSLIGAAIRLGALDHAAGQRLLLRARPTLAEVAAETAALDWRDIGGFAPQIEIMQCQHAHAMMHMFVS